MASRMARIVHMGKLDGYSALLNGTMLELEGRLLWPAEEPLKEAMRRAGLQPSELIIDTCSPVAGMPVSAVSAAAVRHRSGGLPLAA
ncbi:hypothetical protein A6A40_20875 (plasmid) [Azospirillum humicireducens]|uniref:Uncharacterized protein n=1 Tax=Azospirillum humicireducens TaxID=1226968 RepID=A0A2R4VSQ0_9PROT|nr:hypothetical protein [Azospirillum humicireducens]AWB07483.1 hypothetical protein A6A40_20875 [Azospirillum humicireducens]